MSYTCGGKITKCCSVAVGTGYSNTPTVDKVLPAKEMYLRNTCIEQSSIEYVSLLTVVWLEMIQDWFEMIQ